MPRRSAIVLLVLLGLGWPSETSAQPSSGDGPRWEVEVHAGGIVRTRPDEGTIALPGAGESFTATNARPSRYISSWYFGDGAALANEHAAAFSNIVRSSRITPLDPVLTGAVARASDSGSIGFRIGRSLTPRFSAEFSLDYARSTLDLSDKTQRDIEAARASFETFWTELLASANPLQFRNKVVVSSAETTVESGGEIVATGALNVKLRRGGSLTPYVTGGMGGVFRHGSSPRLELRGRYSFLWTADEPFDERDAVTVRWVQPERALLGVAGGGMTYDLSRRHGLRLDLRFHISPSTVDTEISASPSVVVGAPARAFASATTPSVQYSNNPVATGARSTLNGPAIATFNTREGSGVRIDTAITAGYFWRF